MSNYYQPQQQPYAPSNDNLQFFPTSYGPPPTGPGAGAPPHQQSYGFVGGAPGTGGGGGGGGGGAQAGFTSAPGFGAAGGVSGRMGEQGGLRTGWIAAFSTEGYDGEPGLLEELGVDFSLVQAKTLAVLNPFRHIDQHLMDDSDLAGPILFFLLDGFFLLFSGKVHFGYIYGLALLGSISLHVILSLMSPTDEPGSHHQSEQQHTTQGPYGQSFGPGPVGVGVDQQGAGAGGVGVGVGAEGNPGGGRFSATLTFPRSASVLGYCLLPLVATSLVGVVVPMNTLFGHLLTSAAILWCTYSASGIFCAVGRMRGMRALVAYPLGLFYVGFGLMGIFSSRVAGAGGE